MTAVNPEAIRHTSVMRMPDRFFVLYRRSSFLDDREDDKRRERKHSPGRSGWQDVRHALTSRDFGKQFP